ncbi:MAG: anthranilate synthase component I family protein [Bacteroidia bacterium]
MPEPAMRLPDKDGHLRRQFLHWAARQSACVCLDNCGSEVDRYGQNAFLLGVATRSNPVSYGSLDELDEALAQGGHGWLFGFLSYELKGEVEPRLVDGLEARVAFPAMRFFRADVVVRISHAEGDIVVEQGYSEALMQEVNAADVGMDFSGVFPGFQSNFTKEQYCATVERLREHIREGDIYEINLSQCFSAKVGLASPVNTYERLTARSPMPFSGYCQWEGLHLLCASPERFLQLHEGQLLTQPIKGTAPRGATAAEDKENAEILRNSIKELAENVMIVDLSRNDLNRSCETGTVQVPNLFEVQTFPRVLHLVSTITGRKRLDVSAVQAIRNAFPPGSMTGAPKVRACELISQYEQLARGVYSGSLGYFDPSGNFDLNVVIRSLMYDAHREILSYHVGGAITWDSDPEAEYAETLLKAQAIEGLF